MDSVSWRRKRSLVMWSYALPRPTAIHTPRFAIVRGALGLIAAIGDFGAVRRVAITTRTSRAGEISVKNPDGIGGEEMEGVLDRHRDAEHLFFDLALRVSPDAITEEWIEDGASVMLSLDWPDPDAPGQGTPDVSLALSLHVDLYAAESWGASRENRALSVINAPRLAGFLKRLRRELRATLVDLDSGDYAGQVSADGFAPPSGLTH